MKRLLVSALSALTIGTGFPAIAQAQQAPAAQARVSPETVEAVRQFLTAEGLTVGDLNQEGAFVALPVSEPGLTWGVLFFPCQIDNCLDVRFSAAFTNEGVTPDMVNIWNTDRRFLSAHYLRTETGAGGAVVNYDVLMLQPGGVERLGAPLDIWRRGVAAFGLHVGYFEREAEAPPAQ